MELWSAEQALPGLMVWIFSFYATDPSVIRLLFVRANQKTLTLTTFGAILSSSHSVNQKCFLRKSCSLQFSWKPSKMKGCIESPWSKGLVFFSLLVYKHHSEIFVLLARLLDVTALTFTFQGWRSFTWINNCHLARNFRIPERTAFFKSRLPWFLPETSEKWYLLKAHLLRRPSVDFANDWPPFCDVYNRCAIITCDYMQAKFE